MFTVEYFVAGGLSSSCAGTWACTFAGGGSYFQTKQIQIGSSLVGTMCTNNRKVAAYIKTVVNEN